ncbi:M20/M25/M40 family metallo-hydrolase [Pseudoxanthomonas sp. CAU 1598]|uniref:Carboxypeptidase Q n=1 Tax=Pseudomarimonas arenosa TaxID=2774145 RepID=A0AAW3ZFG9_9GAMM|nr:M20/M25/M40 family metallo-hydrolase [Pseudomarimonas arenosa]MBD8524240.1 M20/M25/M40 family metallo-hydrolase [Pseudomarimonas arenosa]
MAIGANSAVAGPDADTLAQIREHALSGNLAFELVESLTTEVGPRLAGSEGDARAQDWAEARMKSLGFDKVWREPVEIPHWKRRHERATVLGEYAQSLHISALGHSIGTGGPIAAEVVELADLAALKAIEDDRLNGKIVFVNHRMTRAINGAGYSIAGDIRSQGPSEAAKRGAIAFVMRSAGTDSHRFPHTGNTKRLEGVHVIPSAALSNPDAEQLHRLLKRKPDLQLQLDIDVGFDGTTTTHNVIGEISGRVPGSGIVVLGAHLDSWDNGTGAVDDGAGIAITMAAAAKLIERGQRPRRSIRMIAFAAEEVGLLGAKAYAKDNAQLMERHVVGMESDFGAGSIYAIQTSARGTALDALQPLFDALAPLDIAFAEGGYGPGPDILPMRDDGVPWFALKQNGIDYFDVHHTADDTLDKIVPQALPQQVAAYALATWFMADSQIELRAPADL